MPGAEVELRQVGDVEVVEPRQHPAGAADPEVRAPDLRPAALDDDAAGDGLGLLEALAADLGAEGGLEAGEGGEEDVEVSGEVIAGA